MSDDSENVLSSEEAISAQKVLRTIEIAWQNEKLAPVILPQQAAMLDLMMGQLMHLEDNLGEVDPNDFRSVVHRMELDRIRYMIGSYLRTRLQKLEDFPLHYLQDEEASSESEKRLMTGEVHFAKNYYDLIEKHLHQVAVRHMPANIQASDDNLRILRPNLLSHVFFRTNTNVSSVIVGADDEEIELAPNTQHLLPYQLISDLLTKECIHLT